MTMISKASELIREIDYPNFPEFARFQIPLDLIAAKLVCELQLLRKAAGIPITPSPVVAGWARTDGSTKSRHYAVGRLSDAGDIFPARGRVLDCWVTAQGREAWQGLGLYADTTGPDGRPWPMMHLDLRSGPRLFWVRENKKDYYYLHSDPKNFWRVVRRITEIEHGF
jgi:hypothetical protein